MGPNQRSCSPRALPAIVAAAAILLAGGTALFAGGATAGEPAAGGWRFHGGDAGHMQYSPLAQINPENVQRLRVAWVYRTGDARADGRSQIQCNPIVVRGVLYASSPLIKVFALDAASGKALWTFDPFAASGQEMSPLGVNRGVVYWEKGDDRRILFTAGQRLFALDARTGKPILGFGTKGTVDLTEGLDRDVKGLYVLSNTPGALYHDLLILGSRVAEGPAPAAPGHIRAYDVRTGKRRWIFHTVPYPGEPGYETWPRDAWKWVGGANSWTGISVDEARGLVFIPTGSAAFDFWGGDRKGANLYANCMLVLKAGTGERVWHYQVVHHDLWDRDLPAAPVLATVTHDGKKIDVVAQVTKTGHVWIFDRKTGSPLFPVEEVKVPPSDLKGEEAWPSEPVPVKPPPFARQVLTEAEVTDISPEARAAVLARLREVRSGQLFLPPSTQGTVIFPGFDGGAEWGGAAFDPESGLLYVNANEMAWILTMVDTERPGISRGAATYRQYCAACHGLERQGAPQQAAPALDAVAERWGKANLVDLIDKGKGVMPSFAFLSDHDKGALASFLLGEDAEAPTGWVEPAPSGVPYTHTGYNRFLDPQGYPAVKPPWGTLNAINLNAGTIDWKVPLGEFPALTRRGIPQTGTENYGGPVVTAGGLVFIGATQDEKFRAFDKKTGRVLFEADLPAGGYATPAVYQVNGKQYVVIAAGGGKMGTKSGDAYVAFALPD
jgi:quinoprotein glucose dehydrogenase